MENKLRFSADNLTVGKPTIKFTMELEKAPSSIPG
jgi:hypothetical protein